MIKAIRAKWACCEIVTPKFKQRVRIALKIRHLPLGCTFPRETDMRGSSIQRPPYESNPPSKKTASPPSTFSAFLPSQYNQNYPFPGLSDPDRHNKDYKQAAKRSSNFILLSICTAEQQQRGMLAMMSISGQSDDLAIFKTTRFLNTKNSRIIIDSQTAARTDEEDQSTTAPRCLSDARSFPPVLTMSGQCAVIDRN